MGERGHPDSAHDLAHQAGVEAVRATRTDSACPDHDGEEERWCPMCDADTLHLYEVWGRILWTKCQECGAEDEDDGT